MEWKPCNKRTDPGGAQRLPLQLLAWTQGRMTRGGAQGKMSETLSDDKVCWGRPRLAVRWEMSGCALGRWTTQRRRST